MTRSSPTPPTTWTNGKWIGISTGVDLDHEPTTMEVELTHTAGFSFTFGLFASIQLLEVFHAGASVDLVAAELLDILPQISPSSNTPCQHHRRRMERRRGQGPRFARTGDG
jgi:hypothetical protein